MQRDLGPVLQAAYPQAVATLIRVLGDIDRATDATQDALVKAMQVWSNEGLPDNPVGWLVTVGRNRALDQLRREQRQVSLDSNVVVLPVETESVSMEDVTEDYSDDDDMLRLLFTCGHPALNQNGQMVLMLKVVLGFSTEEIARALLASPASVEKRLTRAKARLKEQDVEYEVPAAADVPERLEVVLQAIYVLFNEGYSRLEDAEVTRSSLVQVAIRLGRIVARLFRYDPRPRALLALMLLAAARLPGRVNAAGEFVPLTEQDRSIWDAQLIKEGVALIDAVYAAKHPPGAYQIQAAISAIHAQADSVDETDWQQIAALYLKLEEYDPSPAVRVNRAVALCYTEALAEAEQLLLDEKLSKPLQTYQPYFAALALLYELQSKPQAAVGALERAIELADFAAQRNYLQRWQSRLNPRV